jgi:hypothetical protein
LRCSGKLILFFSSAAALVPIGSVGNFLGKIKLTAFRRKHHRLQIDYGRLVIAFLLSADFLLYHFHFLILTILLFVK